jgi:drug/metabolite transporter (DMT)-like permease
MGITLGLLSAFFYALVIISYRHFGKTNVPVVSVNFWRYVAGTIFLVPFIMFEESLVLTGDSLLPLMAFGLFFAVLATNIHAYGLGLTKSLRSSVLGKTEPVFAILYAALFLNEIPSVITLIGGLLIVGSSVWLAMQNQGKTA